MNKKLIKQIRKHPHHFAWAITFNRWLKREVRGLRNMRPKILIMDPDTYEDFQQTWDKAKGTSTLIEIAGCDNTVAPPKNKGMFFDELSCHDPDWQKTWDAKIIKPHYGRRIQAIPD